MRAKPSQHARQTRRFICMRDRRDGSSKRSSRGGGSEDKRFRPARRQGQAQFRQRVFRFLKKTFDTFPIPRVLALSANETAWDAR